MPAGPGGNLNLPQGFRRPRWSCKPVRGSKSRGTSRTDHPTELSAQERSCGLSTGHKRPDLKEEKFFHGAAAALQDLSGMHNSPFASNSLNYTHGFDRAS